MRTHRITHLVLTLLLLAGLALHPLAAQTNLETNAGVQFNFSTPGAGNLALGGAFLALAFDASAAYTNPAGLTVITEPEALVEARHWRYTHVYTDHGRIEGQAPSNCLGAPDCPDTIRGLRDGRASDEVNGLSFLSGVYPRGDWTFAAYRHELVNFEANFSTFGAYLELTRGRNPLGIPGTLDGRLASLRNRMDVDVVAYGGSAAYRLGGGLSLGLTFSYFDFSIDSKADRYLPALFAEPSNSDPLVNSQTQQGQDNDWGFAAGFHWESPQKLWSLGGVYRQGPDFTFQTRSQPEAGALQEFNQVDKTAFFHVPDVYGVGVAIQPRDSFRAAFDYDRVRYSQLTQGFVDIFDLKTLSPVTPGKPEDFDPAELDRFVIDDADELHLGFEYAFLQHWPVVSLRAGAWYDPDHSLRFEGQNVGFRAVFRPRGDQMHYTFGAGIATRRVQIDAAIDHSDRVSVVSLSAGYRIKED